MAENILVEGFQRTIDEVSDLIPDTIPLTQVVRRRLRDGRKDLS
jgi:hypothetical protein